MRKRITIRRASERGYANHGWLNSFHTFSFANYHDSKFSGWSSLRVLNEDRVKPGKGFGAHPHRDYEIFSYVVSGSLEHSDNMANREVIKRGDVQFTSAGRGIMHAEYNHSHNKPVHFLQVWLEPDARNLTPSYQTGVFSDEDKQGKLCLIVTSKYHPEDDEEATTKKRPRPVVVNQNAQVYASLLARDESVSYDFGAERCGYVHVVDTGGQVRLVTQDDDKEEIVLESGDGAFIEAGTQVQLVGGTSDGEPRSEFLFFDLAATNARA